MKKQNFYKRTKDVEDTTPDGQEAQKIYIRYQSVCSASPHILHRRLVSVVIPIPYVGFPETNIGQLCRHYYSWE